MSPINAKFKPVLTALKNVYKKEHPMRHYQPDLTLPEHFVPTKHFYSNKKHGILRHTKYGRRRTITYIPGTGIGKELAPYIRDVLCATNAPIVIEHVKMESSERSHSKGFMDFMNGVISVRRNGICLKGHIEQTAAVESNYSRNVELRASLDMFVNLVELKTFPGIERGLDCSVDVVIIRHNLEGEYTMLEHSPRSDIVEHMKLVTAFNSKRVARYAFDYAIKNNRKMITALHQAHIFSLADVTFLEANREIAAEYPEIIYRESTMSAATTAIVGNPRSFDIVLTPNMYGCFLTNFLCGLLGGPGLFCGQNYGKQNAVFEPAVRSKGKDIVGKGIANPTAMLKCVVKMLEFANLPIIARSIDQAVDDTINIDKIYTPDCGGKASTKEMIDNIIKRLK